MKIEDLKVGRVYRAKRPRVVHTLGGSYINDRQILSISPEVKNESRTDTAVKKSLYILQAAG